MASPAQEQVLEVAAKELPESPAALAFRIKAVAAVVELETAHLVAPEVPVLLPSGLLPPPTP